MTEFGGKHNILRIKSSDRAALNSDIRIVGHQPVVKHISLQSRQVHPHIGTQLTKTGEFRPDHVDSGSRNNLVIMPGGSGTSVSPPAEGLRRGSSLRSKQALPTEQTFNF